MDILLIYAGTMLLAILIEAGVEYIFGTPMDKIEKLKPYKWLLMYISLAFGIALAWYYRLDLPALVMKLEPSEVGYILTGTALSRGANWLNDLWQKYIAKV